MAGADKALRATLVAEAVPHQLHGDGERRGGLEASQQQGAALQQQDAQAGEPRPAADPDAQLDVPHDDDDNSAAVRTAPRAETPAAEEAVPRRRAPGRVARAGLLAALGLLL